MKVKKKNVKDRGDGTIELVYNARPGDLPQEYRNAPVRSRFVLIIKGNQEYPDFRVECFKSTSTDPGDGTIAIKLITLSGLIPDELIYIKANSLIDIEIEPSADNTESNLPFTTEERIKTFKTTCVLTSDIDFINWIATRHPFVQTVLMESPELTEESVSEAIRREIQAHSRNEILTSAIIAERAQILIKKFRKNLWASKNKQKTNG